MLQGLNHIRECTHYLNLHTNLNTSKIDSFQFQSLVNDSGIVLSTSQMHCRDFKFQLITKKNIKKKVPWSNLHFALSTLT